MHIGLLLSIGFWALNGHAKSPSDWKLDDYDQLVDWPTAGGMFLATPAPPREGVIYHLDPNMIEVIQKTSNGYLIALDHTFAFEMGVPNQRAFHLVSLQQLADGERMGPAYAIVTGMFSYTTVLGSTATVRELTELPHYEEWCLKNPVMQQRAKEASEREIQKRQEQEEQRKKEEIARTKVNTTAEEAARAERLTAGREKLVGDYQSLLANNIKWLTEEIGTIFEYCLGQNGRLHTTSGPDGTHLSFRPNLGRLLMDVPDAVDSFRACKMVYGAKTRCEGLEQLIGEMKKRDIRVDAQTMETVNVSMALLDAAKLALVTAYGEAYFEDVGRSHDSYSLMRLHPNASRHARPMRLKFDATLEAAFERFVATLDAAQ